MKRSGYILSVLCVALIGIAVLVKNTVMQQSVSPLATLNTIEPRPANWAQPVDASYHLYKMNDELYRSALPRADDVPWLLQQNVKTVINFYQKPDSSWLQTSTIEQVHIPLRTDRINDVDVIRVLRSISSAQQKGKVLIHCKHGQNRTGLIAAMYRVVFENWSKADALAEMQHGYGGEKRMDGATRYFNKVDVAAIQQALTSGACSTKTLAWCNIAQWFAQQTNRVLGEKSQNRSAWLGQAQNVFNPTET